ncbi:MAG TPA: hypothetical protein VM165_03045 [Planctomycetaceae bacterium]|nr:hypothetical protein [Planctomycetaceae bacterium]
MFFRFAMALALVVLISLIGAGMEKETFALRRRVGQQQFRLDVLTDRLTALRLEAQRLGTPARNLEPLEAGRTPLQRLAHPMRPARAGTPLMNWTAPE